MMLTLAIISTLLFGSFILLNSKRFRDRRHLLKLMSQFKGPPGNPIFGNALDFLGDTTVIWKSIMAYLKAYDTPFRIWLLHSPYIVITKPEDIKIIASKNLEKHSVYRFLTDITNDGLLTCSFQKWKRLRRFSTRAFTNSALTDDYLPVFNEYGQIFVEKMNIKIDGKEYRDIRVPATAMIGRVTLENMLGCRLNYEESVKLENNLDAFQKDSMLHGTRMIQPLLHPSAIFKIYRRLHGSSSGTADLRALVISAVQKKMYTDSSQIGSDKTAVDGKSAIDKLSSSTDGDYLDETEMIGHIMTLFFAGTETTAILFSSTLLMLAIHPEIQNKVYEEVQNVFGDSNRMATAEDLEKLVYLKQCVKETLRWTSVIPVIVRTPEEDIEITDGHVIPAAAGIIIAPCGTHRDKSIYPEPDRWNPDNFHSEKEVGRHPLAFIPFGVGSRVCLGYKYAMMNLLTLVSIVIRNFKLSTYYRNENEIEFSTDIMARLTNGFPMKFEHR